jgi:lysophospholipase L1-like esterase
MKRKKKQIIIGAFFLFLLFLIILAHFYLQRILIFEPVQIRNSAISSKEASFIEIYGITPLGDVAPFQYNFADSTWNYPYAFHKAIYIALPANVFQKTKTINVFVGNEKYIVPLKDLKLTDKHSNKQVFILPYSIKSKGSFIAKILSIFHWPPIIMWVKIILTITILLFGIIISIRIIKRKSPVTNLSENQKKSISNRLLIIMGWSLLAFIILTHVLICFLTNLYLVTSGIFLYIFLAILSYYFLLLLKKLFHFKFKAINIRMIITSTAICLVIIEGLFIVTGYKSTYAEKRTRFFYKSPFSTTKKGWYHLMEGNHDLKTPEYCYHRTINSDKLSDIEHKIYKTQNEYRIIGLGDSFTEGDGADTDSTWLKFLERSLSKFPIKKQLTFFNAGMSGSDPFYEFILLKQRLLKYKPDIVLVAINKSDINDIAVRGGMERFKPDSTVEFNAAPWFEPIFAVSHISRLFFDAFGYTNLLFSFTDKQVAESKIKISQIITSFKDLSIKNKFNFIVIFHPHKNEIDKHKFEFEDMIKPLEAREDITVLNMFTYFSEIEKIDSSNSQNYFWKYDGHHNAKGYAAFARGVEWKLKETGILDSLMQK